MIRLITAAARRHSRSCGRQSAILGNCWQALRGRRCCGGTAETVDGTPLPLAPEQKCASIKADNSRTKSAPGELSLAATPEKNGRTSWLASATQMSATVAQGQELGVGLPHGLHVARRVRQHAWLDSDHTTLRQHAQAFRWTASFTSADGCCKRRPTGSERFFARCSRVHSQPAGSDRQ